MKGLLDQLRQSSGVQYKRSSPLSTADKAGQNKAYNVEVEQIRETEYPTLQGTTYLDHAGTTPYANSAIESWIAELTRNLFGNPHSASAASQLSTRRIDDIRLKVLQFFNASPDEFDIVFVPNATAAIKLVAEAFRDNENGFSFFYHNDAHTSVVGCRELATQVATCFENDGEVEKWIRTFRNATSKKDTLRLFAYTGQSNMTGRRLPLRWCREIREASTRSNCRGFTLLDAASLVSTAPLDLSDSMAAPDFVGLSFYKIFGFPDLGALIVRRESGDVLMQRQYFAGGTVDAVTSKGDMWHAKKSSLHAALEEGTLPFHNILALDHVMTVHRKLFGLMKDVSAHTIFLAQQARDEMNSLRHFNGSPVCQIYGHDDESEYGALVAFNLKDSTGRFHSATEVEKLCVVKGIQLRTGGLCNPGGIAQHLGLSPSQIRAGYDAGRRCGGEDDMIEGQPTGAIRISFGAMSTKADLHCFISFVKEFYVERHVLRAPSPQCEATRQQGQYFIDALSVFPIKSCAAFEVPACQKWPVTALGLAWDREWCLVHEGTNVALSQKKYPGMALLHPRVDLEHRRLVVSHAIGGFDKAIHVELDDTLSLLIPPSETYSKNAFRLQKSKVCDDTVPLHIYTSSRINQFFSEALGVPCCLARYARSSARRAIKLRRPKGSNSPERPASSQPQIMLANESPFLIVSKSSVNELNRQIQAIELEKGVQTPRHVSASSFRANIVVAQQGKETPYAEDTWISLSIRSTVKSTARQDETIDEVSAECISASPTDMKSPSLPGSINSSSKVSRYPSRSSRTSVSDFDVVPYSKNLLHPPAAKPSTVVLDVLGPCQRCQMVSINQTTGVPHQEPFSTLAKTRRKGDGRVWFGIHGCVHIPFGTPQNYEKEEECYLQVGDLATPQVEGA